MPEMSEEERVLKSKAHRLRQAKSRENCKNTYSRQQLQGYKQKDRIRKRKSDGTPITKVQSPQKSSTGRVQRNCENENMNVAFDFTKPSTKTVQETCKKLVTDIQNVCSAAKAEFLRRKIDQQLRLTIDHLSQPFFPDQSNKIAVEIFSQIKKKKKKAT